MSDSDRVNNERTNDRSPGQGASGALGGIRTSDTTTRGIRIQVDSAYVPDRSTPKEGSYFFVYHVRIANVGTETAQLVSLEWIITHAYGEVERVKGPGVV